MNSPIAHHLHTYYEDKFRNQRDVRIRNLENITSGWESELYAFDVEYEQGGESRCEELILRIYPGDDAHEKSAHEFHSMKQLHKAGYPVPQVQALEGDNSPFGKPFVIMERIEGQVMWPLLFNSSEERQRELLTLFCQLLVQLHKLDWRPFVDDMADFETRDPYVFVDRWLNTAREALTRFPRPDFLPVVEWLEGRRDDRPCVQPSVVHGDFHPFNILLRNDGSAMVIDWTGLHVTDSRFDLAWTLLLASTHVSVEWRNRILQEYERLAGAEVEQIETFEVFACARRLFGVTISLSEGAERMGMRPEALVMMKQQMGAIERVYDLLPRT